MKCILNDQAKAQIKKPNSFQLITPGGLVDIFTIGGGDGVIKSESKEKTIVKAVWLIALTLPHYSVSIEDLSMILCIDRSKVRDVVHESSLEKNESMILQARREVEESLIVSDMIPTLIERSGYLKGLSTKMEFLTTLWDYLTQSDWDHLEWTGNRGIEQSALF